MKTKHVLSLLFSCLVLLTAQAQVYTKQETNNLFLPKSYTQTQAAVDQAQSDAIGLKADQSDVYSKGQTYNQQQVNNLVSPKADLTAVYPKGQTYSQQQVNDLLAPKANTSDVYPKTQTFNQQQVNDLVSPKADLTAVYPKGQTYSQQQVNDLIVFKMDFQKVASFALAKTNIVVGTPKQFFIANNELYGGTVGNPTPTNSTYDGTNWNHSPALTQNN